MSKFTIRRCLSGDLSSLVGFFRRMKAAYDVNFLPQDKDAFLEKYYWPDAEEKFNYYLLHNRDGAIVGGTGYVPFKGLFCRKPLSGFVATDSIIDPAWRRKLPGLVPLFARTYERMVRGEKLFPLACPASETVAESFKRVRWSQFTWIYKLYSPVVARVTPHLAAAGLCIERIECFDKSFEEFFKMIASDYDFLMHADREFLNQKYCGNTRGPYVILAAHMKRKLSGYLVCLIRDCDIEIVDVTIDIRLPHLILFLMYAAFSYCPRRDIAITTCYVSNKRYFEILRSMGFSCCWEVECLFFKPVALFHPGFAAAMEQSDMSTYHCNGFTQQAY
ncbi:MAG: hypothetical protein ABH865_03235 [Candidatus Omnitrophota bacterium]